MMLDKSGSGVVSTSNLCNVFLLEATHRFGRPEPRRHEECALKKSWAGKPEEERRAIGKVLDHPSRNSPPTKGGTNIQLHESWKDSTGAHVGVLSPGGYKKIGLLPTENGMISDITSRFDLHRCSSNHVLLFATQT